MCSVVICSSIPIAIFYLHLHLNLNLNLNLSLYIHLHLHQVYCFRFLQNRRFFIRNRRFPVMKPADRSAEPPVSVCRRIKLSTEKQMAGQKKQVYRETRYTAFLITFSQMIPALTVGIFYRKKQAVCHARFI